MRSSWKLLSGAAGATLAALLAAWSQAPAGMPPGSVPGVSVSATNQPARPTMKEKVQKSEQEWRKELGPERYHVLREKGTERPFTGAYWNSHEKGVYRCAGCGAVLFTSNGKFDSECGWPSFSSPADSSNIQTQEDRSHFMVRTEVLCAKCGGHLGHVFDDGPGPIGLRYCINSASLNFEKKAEKKK